MKVLLEIREQVNRKNYLSKTFNLYPLRDYFLPEPDELKEGSGDYKFEFDDLESRFHFRSFIIETNLAGSGSALVGAGLYTSQISLPKLPNPSHKILVRDEFDYFPGAPETPDFLVSRGDGQEFRFDESIQAIEMVDIYKPGALQRWVKEYSVVNLLGLDPLEKASIKEWPSSIAQKFTYENAKGSENVNLLIILNYKMALLEHFIGGLTAKKQTPFPLTKSEKELFYRILEVEPKNLKKLLKNSRSARDLYSSFVKKTERNLIPLVVGSK